MSYRQKKKSTQNAQSAVAERTQTLIYLQSAALLTKLNWPWLTTD
jgi:hypothetical protein